MMQSRSFDYASERAIPTCPNYDNQSTIITNMTGNHAQIIDVVFILPINYYFYDRISTSIMEIVSGQFLQSRI